MPTVKELKLWLETTYQDDDIIAHDLWTIEDVYQQAYDENLPEPTKDEAEQVLEMVHHYKDANYGINWDTISHHLGQVINSREEEQANNEKEK